MHTCQCKTNDGLLLKAIFNPDVGMNLMSYSLDEIEVMDQKTLPSFEERMAGMGALIGPHFHHRKDQDIPKLDLKNLFSFIEGFIEKGQKEFFSHGIARYVPWKYEGGEDYIDAHLLGSDTFKGYKLSEIEGQDFKLSFKAKLKPNGLFIDYSLTAEKPSVIGLHYYYSLPDLKGEVSSTVDSQYHHPDGWKPIPSNWLSSKDQLSFKLDKTLEADFGFRPMGNAHKSQIQLQTSTHKLCIHYEASSEENAWQLYHPKDVTYVCLEPVSAKNPREPTSSSAHLKVQIEIVK